MSEIRIDTLEPFDVHPLLVAEDLYAKTPRWRWLRRRTLAGEVRRIMADMSATELQQMLNNRRARMIEAKELLRHG